MTLEVSPVQLKRLTAQDYLTQYPISAIFAGLGPS
jgi:hypothetical protein